ncbi:dihydrofolate reductase family protein [Polymorphospora sp. NPDC051019]|uniref:dihydrofolate reductase family protein n=1 Tax=Polymorphospora sp. NPDC051019 TaxID=3155725 RepID=UPI0034218B25
MWPGSCLLSRPTSRSPSTVSRPAPTSPANTRSAPASTCTPGCSRPRTRTRPRSPPSPGPAPTSWAATCSAPAVPRAGVRARPPATRAADDEGRHHLHVRHRRHPRRLRTGQGGGAATVNQYLTAGLIDELRLHVVPVTLGHGDRLFDGVPPLRLEQVSARQASLVTHLTYRAHH